MIDRMSDEIRFFEVMRLEHFYYTSYEISI